MYTAWMAVLFCTGAIIPDKHYVIPTCIETYKVYGF